MKRLFVLALALVVLLAIAVSAFAVPAGRTVEFEAKGGPGKVIFDGQVHAGKGLKCSDCQMSAEQYLYSCRFHCRKMPERPQKNKQKAI